MINILYDYQAFEMQKYGGISRYFANIMREIDSHEALNYSVSLLASNNYYLKEVVRKSSIANVLFALSDDRRLSINRNYSRLCLRQDRMDIFHPTYYHPYFLKCLKKPFVLTVHDMIHELYPSYFPTSDPSIVRKKLLIEKASRIIAISESTKRDILNIYPKINEDSISVIHHGHTPMSRTNEMNDIHQQYILFVGTRDGYKNFYNLIDSFCEIVKRYPDILLVCAGGGGFSLMEKGYLELKGITNSVVQKNVTDGALYNLYQKATLFVFPSLYEGFGLPILEAFEAQCPILISDVAPFREVAGDAALYFAPLNIDSLTEGIYFALDNSNILCELRKKGTLRLQSFSMNTCMSKTLALYYSI